MTDADVARYRAVVNELEHAGCRRVEVLNCDTELWQNPATGRVFSVPKPIRSEKTAENVRREAGLT